MTYSAEILQKSQLTLNFPFTPLFPAECKGQCRSAQCESLRRNELVPHTWTNLQSSQRKEPNSACGQFGLFLPEIQSLWEVSRSGRREP